MTKITVFLAFGENRAFAGDHLHWRVTDDGALKVLSKDLVGNSVVRAWFQSTEWRWFEVERGEK